MLSEQSRRTMLKRFLAASATATAEANPQPRTKKSEKKKRHAPRATSMWRTRTVEAGRLMAAVSSWQPHEIRTLAELMKSKHMPSLARGAPRQSQNPPIWTANVSGAPSGAGIGLPGARYAGAVVENVANRQQNPKPESVANWQQNEEPIPLPENEYQARVLSELPPEEQGSERARTWTTRLCLPAFQCAATPCRR